MALSIDDLLKALQSPNQGRNKLLPNDKNTWERIGAKDSFQELGLSSSELDSFLKEWVNSTPYNNL